jgi:heterodisulfide reductase subunit C
MFLREASRRVAKAHGSLALFVIEGGDHSFHAPKTLHKTEEEIFTQIAQKSLEWLKIQRVVAIFKKQLDKMRFNDMTWAKYTGRSEKSF